jgi:hypothetical protein
MLSSKCVSAIQKEDIIIEFLNEVEMEEDTCRRWGAHHRVLKSYEVMYPWFKLYLVSHFKSRRKRAAEQQVRASITLATTGTIPVGKIPIKSGSMVSTLAADSCSVAAAAGSVDVSIGVASHIPQPPPGCSPDKVTPLDSSSVTANRSKNRSESEMSNIDSDNENDININITFDRRPRAVFLCRKWQAHARKDEAHGVPVSKDTVIGNHTELDDSGYFTSPHPAFFCSLSDKYSDDDPGVLCMDMARELERLEEDNKKNE